jgi:hypothetical protein
MMSPETSVRILNNTYECGYIQDVSMMGFFTEASCHYFSSVVNDACGCNREVESNGPSSAPTSVVEGSSNTTQVPSNETDLDTETVPIEQVCHPCPNGNIVDLDALVMVPGQSEKLSCEELEKAGLDGSIPIAVCPMVQDLAAVPCCGKEEEPDNESSIGDICNPCGPDKEMTELKGMVSIPQQGMLTCNELAIMGRVAEENEDWCVLIRPFVQTPCGCQSTVPTDAPSSLAPRFTQIPESNDAEQDIQDSGAFSTRIISQVLGVVLFTWSLFD